MCDFCGDTKRIGNNAPVGHPLFGRTMPCPKCNQVAVTYNSGLLADERNVRIASMVTKDRPGAAAMLAAGETFLKSPCGFLSVYGSNGNAKTVLLQGIVNACIERGIEAHYLTAHTLMDYLYSAFDPKVTETDRARIARLAGVPVLCIDEFDKARETPYAFDMQHHLIDQRYRAQAALGTVIAWNGDLDTLPWPAVVSRIREGVVIENIDPDMRPANSTLRQLEAKAAR